jgi:hypothetical protein
LSTGCRRILWAWILTILAVGGIAWLLVKPLRSQGWA